MTKEELQQAHNRSIRHKAELGMSDKCGCYYCQQTFEPKQITEWCDKGVTALCPFCGIDSVIGSASGFDLTPEFLQEMNERWFSMGDDDGSSKEGTSDRSDQG